MTKAELNRLQDRMFRSVVLALEHEINDGQDEDMTLVDVLVDHSAVEPLEELENRELQAYLRDAVGLLPERQRLVIVGYFLENKTSQELADFLGVTESRISQLRSEALAALKEGIQAQYDPRQVQPEDVSGRVAVRKANFARNVGQASVWKHRLDEIRSVGEVAAGVS